MRGSACEGELVVAPVEIRTRAFRIIVIVIVIVIVAKDPLIKNRSFASSCFVVYLPDLCVLCSPYRAVLNGGGD